MGIEANLIKGGLRLKLAHNIIRMHSVHPFKGSYRLMKLLTKLIPAPKGPSIVHTYYGFDIIVDPIIDGGLERRIYYSGTYESGTLNIIEKSLRKGDTFIDVGGNIGLMSLFASQVIGKNGTVYSF